MKILVIGATGLVGSKVVGQLRGLGHEVSAVSPDSGLDTVGGEGLQEALSGAAVIVDVTNSPWFEEAPNLKFFRISTGNLLAAAAAAGVRHHVALSVVGTERLVESGYFRAKMTQEKRIKASPVPYTILRSTQFFELISGIARPDIEGESVRVPAALVQPVLSDEVAAALADVAVAPPANRTVEIAGPDRFALDDLAREALRAAGDTREVVPDAHARYFGALPGYESLTPDCPTVIGTAHFAEWIHSSPGNDRCKPSGAPSRNVRLGATVEPEGARIIRILGHELRGRLACMKNAAELLDGETLEEAMRRQVAGIVDRQVGGITRLVDDLTDLARLQSGDLRIKCVATPLGDVIEQALEVVRPLVDTQGHTLSVELPPESFFLECDPLWLSQAFQNLVANAAKYTEPGGRICIDVRQDGTDAVVEVGDNGKGISSTDLEAIFDLYVRADKSNDRPSSDGLGIGLHLARLVIEAHGGCIAARSRGRGLGSEFIVRLPGRSSK